MAIFALSEADRGWDALPGLRELLLFWIMFTTKHRVNCGLCCWISVQLFNLLVPGPDCQLSECSITLFTEESFSPHRVYIVEFSRVWALRVDDICHSQVHVDVILENTINEIQLGCVSAVDGHARERHEGAKLMRETRQIVSRA